MAGKSNAKSKDDIKLTITAVAFTIALALWNFLSGAARKPVQTADTPAPTDPPTAEQTIATQTIATQTNPVKIYLGGPPPATAAAAAIATPATMAQPLIVQPRVVQPQPTPKPRKSVARTSSSHP